MTWKIPSQHLFLFWLVWDFCWIVLSCAIGTHHPCSTRRHSRNETRLCHRGCGGALSAALTCTESTLVEHKQHNWSVDVPRSVGSEFLPDHWETGGSGAGIPHRGGAHLQPLLRAAGEVRRLLRWWEAGMPSHPHHKRHNAAVENQASRAGSRICWDDICGASDMWM